MSTRKITCTITGKSYTFGKDYFDKKVKEYIDEPNLKKYFITKKAKNYLNKGYSIQEIRNILNVDEVNLPGPDSQAIQDLIEFHKIQGSHTAKKISNTLNFATHKSDSEVAEFINTIRDYE
jgi:hypothetical protein|tara:strand:- start:82 stop:444 length:363 start_codon:yes stop_codon:yes gene_type:complete